MHRVAGETSGHSRGDHHHHGSHSHGDHDHGHAHGHGHAHDHGHAHGSGVPRRRKWPPLAFAAVLLGWASTCVHVVDETQFVVVTQMGEIKQVYDNVGDDPANDRGLHWKLPWPIQTARSFDRRLQVMQTPPMEMLTGDPDNETGDPKNITNITIECYVCWRIADAEQFLKAVQTVTTAEDRLGDRVGAALRNRVAQVALSDLVSLGADSAPAPQSGIRSLTQGVIDELTRGSVGGRSQQSVRRMGIELVDVQLKRFNLPEQNRDAVYGRMRSERQRIVADYTSQGESRARMIRSRAAKEAEQILAYAEAEALRIRGKADAEATAIYTKAHSQDPEFFELIRTLEAFEKLLSEKTTLVLSASNPMFRLLSEGLPRPAAPGASGNVTQTQAPPAPDKSATSATSNVAETVINKDTNPE